MLHNEGGRGYSAAYLLIAAFIFLLSLFHFAFSGALAFSRELVGLGEIWRLLSCNFVHLNFNHLMLNLVGLGIVALVAPLSIHIIFFSCVWLSVIVGISLYYFSLDIMSYVGFSGVLHGMLALGLALQIFQTKIKGRIILVVLFIALLGKVTLEQLPSYNRLSLENIIGSAIVVDAHLYGVIGGLVFYVLLCFFKVKK